MKTKTNEQIDPHVMTKAERTALEKKREELLSEAPKSAKFTVQRRLVKYPAQIAMDMAFVNTAGLLRSGLRKNITPRDQQHARLLIERIREIFKV